ncbi:MULTISPECIES: ABC transporter ATP-binding protein [Glaesserella]|uniref:ABC transporter ATP-binding protein n=1 Tax=Glaesserella australis TaxID=2094024 RepID=A0A328BXP7_9PAST|nr:MULTISPECIES: ATP-binding cassette domain-containing protein [Glaesserella]AUI66118.1 ABC transporter ATP-binding protein [Glaesserella sp. 15-184]RAL17852.1 ABC transporter ATP-binding protein [Glaesserella australis]
MPLLKIQNLCIHTLDGTELVEPISLSLESGKNITILGETGSGKSLLIQGIMGALPQGLTASGEIFVENCKIDEQSDRLPQLWGKTLVMLPQEPRRSLNPLIRISRQLWESFRFVAGLSPKNAEKAGEIALTQLGLADAQQRYPHQLSGGMAQRASFAIATASGGKILLADEPTKGLDPKSKQEVINLLKQAYEKGGGLLTITHDIDVATQLGGYIFVMRKGKLVEQGEAEQLLKAPQHTYTQALIGADPQHWQPLQKIAKNEPLVSVKNLSVARGNRTLFQGLSFDLHKGEILGIVGHSGIGKSSLADVLCGLLKQKSGDVIWHSQSHKKHQVLKLYQDPPEAFAPNVSLQTLLDDVIEHHQLDRSQIPTLLQQLALSPDILQRNAENVSGGELQRVAILRALLLEPVLLFADEVTSRLDPITQQETIALLIEQCRARNCGLIIVSHDPFLIERSCDKVINLENYL